MTLPLIPLDIVIAARAFGALLFATAVWGKIRNFEEFRGILMQYQLLPATLAVPAAIFVVSAEVIAAGGLLIAPIAPMAAMLGIALLLLFTGAIGINLARGETAIECGCFRTALRQPLSVWLLARNFLCLVLLSFAAFPLRDDIPVMALFAGLAAGLSCLMLIMAFSVVLSLREQAAEFRRRYSR